MEIYNLTFGNDYEDDEELTDEVIALYNEEDEE